MPKYIQSLKCLRQYRLDSYRCAVLLLLNGKCEIYFTTVYTCGQSLLCSIPVELFKSFRNSYRRLKLRCGTVVNLYVYFFHHFGFGFTPVNVHGSKLRSVQSTRVTPLHMRSRESRSVNLI